MNATPSPVPTEAPPAGPRRVWLVAGLVLFGVALAGGLAAGTVPRLKQDQVTRDRAAAATASPPRVSVATAARVTADAPRVLPGSCLPLTEAAIYPRTTGYVKRRAVDIGDRVRAGQVLAEIAAPEVDAQLEQARATLLQNRANLVRSKAQEKFALAEQKREEQQIRAGVGSQTAHDSAVAAAGVATATVHAAEATLKVDAANVQRLEALQSFQQVTAPFDGAITARNVDAGALVLADSPTTTRELFHLMRTDVVRVWVNVPQTFATGVKCGQAATVHRQDDPARTFAGTVARTGDALDPVTRTLLTELHVPNPDGALRPGMYLQVKFTFDRTVFPVLIPSAAVVIRAQAPTVGVLGGDRTVRYRSVQLGRDWGTTVEVNVGLSPGETVVVRPGDDLPEGAVVDPVPQADK